MIRCKRQLLDRIDAYETLQKRIEIDVFWMGMRKDQCRNAANLAKPLLELVSCSDIMSDPSKASGAEWDVADLAPSDYQLFKHLHNIFVDKHNALKKGKRKKYAFI